MVNINIHRSFQLGKEKEHKVQKESLLLKLLVKGGDEPLVHSPSFQTIVITLTSSLYLLKLIRHLIINIFLIRDTKFYIQRLSFQIGVL